jgi:multicomponent Na+:H+ antiporter subunit B
MSRTTRTAVFLAGAAGLGALLVLAFLGAPPFGGNVHPYRDLAVPAALRHVTPNAVSSVNFDQRALDTLGEETILLGSVLGAAVLLRPGRQEARREPPDAGVVLPATRLGGYLVLPVALLLGLDVVAHGHLTPGGGFQGGVVLATGLHLLYVAGSYPALRRLRPVTWYEHAEAAGAGAFAALGAAGLFVSGAFLANFLPLGQFQQLLSSGTVLALSVATGCEVAAGVVVLLAQFLEQTITIDDRAREHGG